MFATEAQHLISLWSFLFPVIGSFFHAPTTQHRGFPSSCPPLMSSASSLPFLSPLIRPLFLPSFHFFRSLSHNCPSSPPSPMSLSLSQHVIKSNLSGCVKAEQAS